MVRMALALRFVFRAMCFVLFSSDRSLAFMPFTLPNNALVCDLYRILIDIDWFSCVQTCYNEDRCISYNFKNSVSGTGLCELNKCGVEKSGTCNPKTLVYTPGFVFQQLRKETSQVFNLSSYYLVLTIPYQMQKCKNLKFTLLVFSDSSKTSQQLWVSFMQDATKTRGLVPLKVPVDLSYSILKVFVLCMTSDVICKTTNFNNMKIETD